MIYPAPRAQEKGNRAIFVRKTAKVHFDTLQIKRLFCEPYALNVAPNRRAGGSLHIRQDARDSAGPMNFHQPVTRWMIERESIFS